MYVHMAEGRAEIEATKQLNGEQVKKDFFFGLEMALQGVIS